ncbi:MAG: glycosyltransferase family 9 protein [Nanoarchaeota archaeon]|nr:glycosyltransferase family 9 protein [Nanoarchaeota archaeon]
MRKILVISLGGIGDLIMATPMIKSLKAHYPKSKIDLLLFPYGGKEVLENSKYIEDTYIYVDRNHTLTKKRPSIIKSFSSTLSLLLKLRAERYDLTISVIPSSSNKLALLAKIIGAKKRIGFDSKYYTSKIKIDPKSHKVDNNLSLLSLLKIPQNDRKQYFHIGKENELRAVDFIMKHGLKNKKIVGIHPGSYWKRTGRQWGADNFAELADALNIKKDVKVLFVIGPSEKGIEKEIRRLMKTEPILINDQSLKDTAAIIKNCVCFIGNDSGITHMAEALEVPVVIISGFVNFNFTGPYSMGNRKNVLQPNLLCIKNCPVALRDEKKGDCHYACYKLIRIEDVKRRIDKFLK